MTGATTWAEVLLKLAPGSTAGHDRLANLAYHAGDLDRAAKLLESWHVLAPTDHWPLVRRAVIEQQRGDPSARSEAIRKAVALTRCPLRAEITFLGARLALQEWLKHLTATAVEAGEIQRLNGEGTLSTPLHRDPVRQALALLDQCLGDNPEHEAALWSRAAVCSILDHHEDLVAQSAIMRRLEEVDVARDPRFFFFAAVCHLAARDYRSVLESANKAAKDPALAVECGYLKGWAGWFLQDRPSAMTALRPAALDSRAPSHSHAQALLGKVCFTEGAFEEAVTWWKALDATRRGNWQLEEPLRGTLFVSALRGIQEGQYEKAAEKIREASRLGLRDRRLGPLLTLALIKAGQRLLYS
jgi:hypothetical protein